ncbi:MAG: heparinase II/III family protein [Victivallaceae bacterium]
MRLTRRVWVGGLLSFLGIQLLAVNAGPAGKVAIPYSDPADWSDWQKFRNEVKHPAGLFKAEDIARAKANIKKHPWAADYAKALLADADRAAAEVTPAFAEKMIPRVTAGNTSPCPACRDKKMRWLPNNVWSWSPARPDEVKCKACSTVFPNPAYPETKVLKSKWDPEQEFRFVDAPLFDCFGFMSPANPAGIIRGYKLDYALSRLRMLGFAYALSDDPKYAEAARLLFLRLAEVMPKYLVMAGYTYNEYADCDPHEAARNIAKLPADELSLAPGQPDRKLHTMYWSASRLGTAGMDGGTVILLATAYDLVCEAKKADGKPVFSENERLKIEKDVLLEASYLGACDTLINNKSVGNRAGCAVVGLVVGHPGMVRFGLDGFVKTVDDWFLPDGGTSESAAYAMMTMGGIKSFGYGFRNYTEPAGYRPPDGAGRLKNFNACADTNYGNCWQDLIWTLQGDLRFAPLADSYSRTAIGPVFAELIALCYPTPEHMALVRGYGGETPSGAAAQHSLFYRDPEPAAVNTELQLPDVAFPYLAQGYLRTGENGRGSLAILDASNWGGHHHLDSLNLYYWKDGYELLSDLGYLWDHPDKHQTARTLAHNLVMIDGKDQVTTGRGGSIQRFVAGKAVKAMQASSAAYGPANPYRRSVIQLDHGADGSYLVDLFEAGGGKRRDYVFHGPNRNYQIDGLKLEKKSADAAEPPKIRFSPRLHVAATGTLDVSDVEIRAGDGDNLARPFPAKTPAGKLAPGWGHYQGNGVARWEATSGLSGPGVRLVVEKAVDDLINQALQIGQSDGYTGNDALAGKSGESYRIRFAYRGDLKFKPQVMYWPAGAAGDAKQRQFMTIRTISDKAAGQGDWKLFEGTFAFKDTGPVEVKADRRADGNTAWRAVWTIAPDYRFAAHFPPSPGEEVLLADEWGQRSHTNADRGETLPYIFRRRGGAAVDCFVSVFEGARAGRELVRGVTTHDLTDGGAAVTVETAKGKDVIIHNPGGKPVKLDALKLETDARLAVVLNAGGASPRALFSGGKYLRAPGVSLTAPIAEYSGEIAGVENKDGGSCFILAGTLPPAGDYTGQVLTVKTADGLERAYPIRKLEILPGGKTAVHTRIGGQGFRAIAAESWRLPSLAEKD